MYPNDFDESLSSGGNPAIRLRDIVALRVDGDRVDYRSAGIPDLISLDSSGEQGSIGLDASVVVETGDPGIALLIRQANHDELTGLANRSWFLTEVERQRSVSDNAARGALFLIDLDGFKAVNDSWGHGAGDTVLCEVGARLRGLAFDPVIAARFGGDEFAVWVSECSEIEAVLLAERIIAAICEPIPGDLGLSVGASVGWVMSSDQAPVDSLLSRADLAMYAAKEAGGHCHQRFDRTLAAAQVEGRVLQRETRKAMGCGEFVAHRQQIARMNGVGIGYEMLARWEHPRRGLLLPASFLPAIQASGRCAEFDHYMIQRAVELIESERRGPGPTLSTWVNLTEYSLTADVVDCLTAMMAAGVIAPGELVIEVSEEARSESRESVRVLEEIAAMGIGIAIDDFGAGYSRLEAMVRLPVSYVKIDRRFIHGLAGDERQAKIVQALIALIHAIGAEAVAEGVEVEQDRSVLAELGCDYMQGFLIHQPEANNQV